MGARLHQGLRFGSPYRHRLHHYMAELELVTDHVVGLSNGRKVLDGDIAALLDQYGSLEQAYFNVVKK